VSAGRDLPPWQVFIVDDDPDVHVATEFALGNQEIEGRPIVFSHAYSAAEAEQVLADTSGIAVVLLDVVMESDDAGLRLVRVIRETFGLSAPRIILRTGHPGYAPERDVIREYDIDDYRTKSELSSTRLRTTVTTALRTYDRLYSLQEANERLEQLTRELEILNINYLEQREAALAAEHAKSRFLANVSHELRTPLNAIIGFSELSLICVDDGRPVSRTYLADVLDAGRQLATLVDNILDVTQLDARKLLREPVSIQQLIEHHRNVYSADAERLGIRLTANVRDCDAILALDRSCIDKALGHIISNALRYSPRDTDVVISWARADGRLDLTVSDRGPGIPTVIRENLDGAFAIGHEVLTKGSSGLGLGLTICRQFLALIDGVLLIDDRVDGGTCITLSLPDIVSG
jgi:signal transduction histidine kinase